MNKKKNDIYKEDSIDLLDLFSSIWINKKFIVKSTVLFFIIGIFYSLSLKNIYRASSTFYPHYEKTDNSNNLRSLAGLAGINLEIESSTSIPSNLYPKIISSSIFKEKILNEKIKYDGIELSYREYLNNKSSSFSFKEILFFPLKLIPREGLDVNYDSNNNLEILNYSDDEYSIHKSLSNLILISLNEKEGFIEISVDDDNPHVAAQIAIFSEKILQESIIDFKIKNIKETYKFTNDQFEIAKSNFYLLQDSLARFKDKNKNIKSDLFLIKLDRIDFEYNLSKDIYNELALSKEKIAIEVRKNTPIFTIINPVVVPNDKYKPKRILIVLIYSFFGMILASFWVLIKKPLFDFIAIIKKL
tara:strand:+ start:2399 stop:3475 length:1077 start_codon:yes stop_codon:yes gene_type:complete